MKRVLTALLLLAIARAEARALPVDVQSSAAAQEYPVTGMVLKVDRSLNSFTASIEAIPGFMPAMAMPFEVRQKKELDGLVPGAAVEFTLVVDRKSSHAERIRVVPSRRMTLTELPNFCRIRHVLTQS